VFAPPGSRRSVFVRRQCMDMVRRQRLPRRITVVVGLASLCGIVFVPFHLGSVSTFAPAPEHLITSLTAALPDPAPEWSGARHLIVVAGHAVYTAAGRDERALSDESSWYLEPFQHGQLGTMLAHIQRGVALAAADNASLVPWRRRRGFGPAAPCR